VVNTVCAIVVFFFDLRHVRSDQAGVFMYAEPVTAVIFAAIFLSELLTWATAVGGAGVVAAGLLVARMTSVASPPPTGMEAPIVSEALESFRTDGNAIGSPDSDRSEA
jgi:hypothetical protein